MIFEWSLHSNYQELGVDLDVHGKIWSSDLTWWIVYLLGMSKIWRRYHHLKWLEMFLEGRFWWWAPLYKSCACFKERQPLVKHLTLQYYPNLYKSTFKSKTCSHKLCVCQATLPQMHAHTLYTQNMVNVEAYCKSHICILLLALSQTWEKYIGYPIDLIWRNREGWQQGQT